MINRPYIIFYQRSILVCFIAPAHCYVTSEKQLPVMYCAYTCPIASNTPLPLYVFFSVSLCIYVYIYGKTLLNRTRSKMHENFSNIREYCGNFHLHRKCERKNICLERDAEPSFPDITHAGNFNDLFCKDIDAINYC